MKYLRNGTMHTFARLAGFWLDEHGWLGIWAMQDAFVRQNASAYERAAKIVLARECVLKIQNGAD